MSSALDSQRLPAYLLNASFDRSLVLLPVVVGLTSLLAVSLEPDLFLAILIADLWLLGYHHVIATYMRLGLDEQTRASNMDLWLLLPAMLLLVGIVAWVAGIWVVATVYFFWQWFHYVRQSWGIALVLRMSNAAEARLDRLDVSVFWLVPIAGLAWRCAQQPLQFLEFDFWTPPVPESAAKLLVLVAAGATTAWGFRALRRGRAERHLGTLFIASHLCMFGLGYILTADIDHGWLAINVWHNLQYLLFVYAFNRKRYRSGVEDGSRIVSWLSQPKRALHYVAFTLFLTLVIYQAGTFFAFSLSQVGVAGLVVVFQAVNFHHYVADSRIWKLRQNKIKSTLQTPA